MKIDPNTIYAVDISQAGMLRVVGADAPSFMRTMFAGEFDPCDTLFGISSGPLLTSQGEVVDMVGVIRTGGDELLVMTHTANVSEDFQWLQAHAELSDDNGRIWPDVVVENQSGKLAAMIMYGGDANGAFQELRQICTDSQIFMISCDFPVSTYAVPKGPGHLFIVAPNMASHLGSLLNRRLDVEVLRLNEYKEHLVSSGRICLRLEEAAYAKPDELGLGEYLRDVNDFVGARALGR